MMTRLCANDGKPTVTKKNPQQQQQTATNPELFITIDQM